MYRARPVVLMSLLVLGLTGCDSFRSLAADLNGTADDTLMFWAKLQGIQWQGNRDISSLHDNNSSTVKQYDVDGVASGFSMLSQKHSQLESQLIALDAKKVDEIANDYRNRLVAAHHALSELNKSLAEATKSRDMQSLAAQKSKLEALFTDYVQLCNDKTSVMAQLQSRYDRDFNVAE
jgi:hypothetical protein